MPAAIDTRTVAEQVARAKSARDAIQAELTRRAAQKERETLRPIAERCARDLHTFFERFAWPVLWPGTRFVDNWHLHAICEHLQAVTTGQIQKLIISIPFRMLKSSIVSQAWPAWEWLEKAWLQYLTASYSRDVATRDAVASRRIIESVTYQEWFGDRFTMTSDQNVKTRYENNRGGQRTVTSTDSSGTGFGGHRRIIDDPISAQDANSLSAINASIEFWKGTMATRGNDPKTDAVVVVHQRVHQRDLTGYLLAEESGWEHLVLPMRFDPKNTKTTSIGFRDPRTESGALLHPERISEVKVKELEKTLGKYHSAAQLGQDPESRAGVIFKRDDFRFYRALPELEEIVISVDCTFKDVKTADRVAIQAWGRAGANKYLLRRVAEQMGFAATVVSVRTFKALFPTAIAVLIEDKANGPAVIESVRDEIEGVLPIEPFGGKAARAYAMQPEHEAGNIWVPDPTVDPEVEEFLAEVCGFDGLGAKHDDEVDAMTQYVNWCRMRGGGQGLRDFFHAQVAAAALKKTNGAAVPVVESANGGANLIGAIQ